jgi:surface protein
MHYGTKDRTKDLPDEVITLIIEMALKGKSSEVLSTMAQVDQRFRKLVPEANFFRYASVKDIRKHPLFALAWRKIANMPLDAWLMGPGPSNGGESSELQTAIKQLFERSIGEWYHFRPDLFHPMVKILHDTTSSDRKYQLASDKLQSFMDHLDSEPCAECAILQKEGPEGPEGPSGPKEQIRRIINKEFRPVEIGQSESISVLVGKYFKDPKDADLKKYGHLCVWNTGAVENMTNVFCSNWKSGEWDVRLWDTGSVRCMKRAFWSSTGPFSGVEFWDTRNVKDMSMMLYRALLFNQNIGMWDTGNVENMRYMFYHAISFNRNIGTWDTGNVEDMSYMFYNATSFNQDIGEWKTGKVKDMGSMFNFATSFNQNISKWDTGKVEDMTYMFKDATSMRDEYKPVDPHKPVGPL